MTYLHDRPMTRTEDAGYAETMAGRIEEVAREAIRLGVPMLLAKLDQIEAQFRDVQDAELGAILEGRVG